MALRIVLAPELADLVGQLPGSTLRRIDTRLAALAELAEGMPPEAPCWDPFRPEAGEGGERLYFYAGDCCVRFELHPDARCLRVTELARIRLGPNVEGPALPVPQGSA